MRPQEFILIRPEDLKDIISDAVKIGLRAHIPDMQNLAKSLDTDQEWYEHKRACTFASVGQSTLRADRAKGMITGRKIGRKWEYHIDDLKAYKERKAAAKSQPQS